MAIFEFELNGKTYEIDAPDMAAATKIAETFQADRPGMASGMARAAGQGLTFGFGDEIEAGIRTLGGLAGDYTQTRDDIRNRVDQFRDDHPVAAYGSEIAASAIAPGGLARTAVKAGLGAGKAVAGAAGLSGAAYGAGAAENMEDVPAEMLKGGGTGLALGTLATKAIPATRAVASHIPAGHSGLGGFGYSALTGDPTGLAAGIGGEALRKWAGREAAPTANRLADALRKGMKAGAGTTSISGTSSEGDAKKRRARQELAKLLTESSPAAPPVDARLLEALMMGAP